MSDKIRFRYQADDGYVGRDRPLHISIPANEILECDTIDDAVEMVQERIEDDFLQRVSASYDFDAIREQVAELRANRQQG